MRGCILSTWRHVPATAGQTDARPGGGRFDLLPGCACTWIVMEQVLRPPRLQEQKRKRPDPGAAQKLGPPGSSKPVKDLNFLMAQTCVWGNWGGERVEFSVCRWSLQGLRSLPFLSHGGAPEVPGHPGRGLCCWQCPAGPEVRWPSSGRLVACRPPSVSQHRRPEFAPAEPMMGFTSCPLLGGGPVLVALNTDQSL